MTGNGTFRVGDWIVEPELDRISKGAEHRNLRPMVMELLVYLARRHPHVVSGEELLDELWTGKVVTGGSVYRCVGELREALDDGSNRVYVETITKKGYRLRMPVVLIDAADKPGSPKLRRFWPSITAIAGLSLIAALIWAGFGSKLDDGLAGTERPFIAVLAFENLGGHADDQFSDGLSEDLISRLARVDGLRVISRSSSFFFKGKSVPIPDVSRQLGVDFVVEGSVRRDGDRVRITAQLIDSKADEHLWSNQYDRQIDDVFYIQDEVSQAIVNALKAEFGLQIEIPKIAPATTNLDARSAYVRGRHLVEQRSKDALEAAVEELESAIAFDPDFAAAHAELAIATLLLSRPNYGDMPLPEAIDLAVPLAARAVALDPSLADAHLAKSFIEMMRFDFEQALPHLERAIELNPNHSLAYSWLGSAYDRLGRYEEYADVTRISLELNPLSQPSLVNYIEILIEMGAIEEAEHNLDKLESVSPRAAASLRGEISSLGGKWADALTARLEALRLDPTNAQVRYLLARYFGALGLADESRAVYPVYAPQLYHALGRPDLALQIAESEESEYTGGDAGRFSLALALAATGQYERALPLLESLWRDADERVTVMFFNVDAAAALIASRLAVDANADVSDVVDAMGDDVRRRRKAGMSNTRYIISLDFDEGIYSYFAGATDKAFELIARAANDGHFIWPAEAYHDALRTDPRFQRVLDDQLRRQARERERFLSVVCDENPYIGVWEPLPNTCTRQ